MGWVTYRCLTPTRTSAWITAVYCVTNFVVSIAIGAASHGAERGASCMRSRADEKGCESYNKIFHLLTPTVFLIIATHLPQLNFALWGKSMRAENMGLWRMSQIHTKVRFLIEVIIGKPSTYREDLHSLLNLSCSYWALRVLISNDYNWKC